MDILIANLIFVIRCWLHASESDDKNNGVADKKNLVKQLLEAKQASGKTYSEIANEVGLTNLYTAQLFQNQACMLRHTDSLYKVLSASYALRAGLLDAF